MVNRQSNSHKLLPNVVKPNRVPHSLSLPSPAPLSMRLPRSEKIATGNYKTITRKCHRKMCGECFWGTANVALASSSTSSPASSPASSPPYSPSSSSSSPSSLSSSCSAANGASNESSKSFVLSFCCIIFGAMRVGSNCANCANRFVLLSCPFSQSRSFLRGLTVQVSFIERYLI